MFADEAWKNLELVRGRYDTAVDRTIDEKGRRKRVVDDIGNRSPPATACEGIAKSLYTAQRMGLLPASIWRLLWIGRASGVSPWWGGRRLRRLDLST